MEMHINFNNPLQQHSRGAKKEKEKKKSQTLQQPDQMMIDFHNKNQPQRLEYYFRNLK